MPTALQRCAKLSGACSCRNMLASKVWACRTLSSTLTSPHGKPYRQGVDTRTQHPVRTFPALHASQQHRAKDHIVLAGACRQHLCPGEMEQTGRTHADPLTHITQPPGHARIYERASFFDPGAIAKDIGKSKRRGGLIHIGEQVAEERLVLLERHSKSCLRHVVTVRPWCRQLLAGSTLQVGLEFFLLQIDRSLIIHQVMGQLMVNPTVICRIVGNEDTYHWGYGQIDSIVQQIETRRQLLSYIAIRGIEAEFLYVKKCLATDHL